jgi:hypothetical protein
MNESQSTQVTESTEIKFDGKLKGLPPECSVAEHQSRLKRLEADARARRWQILLPTIMVVLLVLCALAVYLVVMLAGSYEAGDKERAEKILTPVIACLLGYVGGSSRAKH